jgi:tripartite-type tricarboxylate transporter receptor subunit TctC
MPALNRFAILAASLLLLGLAAALAQSDYPNRPVRLIVGFIPGSSADITARVLGQRMTTAWRPQGIDPLSGGPEDFASHIARESKRWGDVATAAGLKK